MTDGERSRLTEAFKKFQAAVVKTRFDPSTNAMFALAMNALGWALDEPGYREAFERILVYLDGMGVVVNGEERR